MNDLAERTFPHQSTVSVAVTARLIEALSRMSETRLREFRRCLDTLADATGVVVDGSPMFFEDDVSRARRQNGLRAVQTRLHKARA